MPIPQIYRTVTMIGAVQQLPTHRTFLRDRYFPCTPATDIFPTEDVLVEYRNGSKKIAPVVMPRKGGINIKREGYKTERYTPPFVAPQRPLTIDDLNRKGFGENLFSQITPEQREAQILGQDLTELNIMIDGREEYMAAQVMLTNGCILKQYADDFGGKYEEYAIQFYEGTNDAVFTTAHKWNATGADIYGDIAAMIQVLIGKGLAAEDLVMSPDVAQVILNDPKIKELLDIKYVNIGSIEPIDLPEGASRLGVINVYGKNINLIVYGEQYEDETTGQLVNYMGNGNVVLTAPAAGRSLYGAVTQLEQSDGAFHTYAARRVPKYTAKADEEVRKLKVSAKPLLIPRNKSPWISASVL
ncbi:MAG: major capsid protein [Blautia sp.]|nr:major capsid protein [Blautia sp.]